MSEQPERSDHEDPGRSTFTEGYIVPIAGLVAFVFALMAGLTAGRALSGDPVDAIVTVALAGMAVLALRVRSKAVAARASTDGE